jgi:hypothetical protein
MPLDRLVQLLIDKSSGKEGCDFTFTLEPGKGETYSHGQPTLYAHGEYESWSVLAGRDRRIWVESWIDWKIARDALAAAQAKFRQFGFQYEDFGPGGGSTHVPVDVVTAHLPDSEDE